MRKLIVAGAFASAIVAAPAHADLTWQLDGVTAAGPGAWNWTYALRLTTTTERMRPNASFQPPAIADYAAIVDFPGYVNNSAIWTSAGTFLGALVTEQTTAGAFFAPGQSDAPGLPNFRILNVSLDPFQATSAPTTLGTLRLTSTAGGTPVQSLDQFSQVTTAAAPTTPLYLSGTLAGPIPEPGTYAMLLAGLAGVGFFARKRMTA